MKYTVYGIRLRGEAEIRYVGQTARTLEARLLSHVRETFGGSRPRPMTLWLHDNLDRVEIFPVGEAQSREEAKRFERAIITLCLSLNHRLFNTHCVPPERRILRNPFLAPGTPLPSGAQADGPAVSPRRRAGGPL